MCSACWSVLSASTFGPHRCVKSTPRPPSQRRRPCALRCGRATSVECVMYVRSIARCLAAEGEKQRLPRLLILPALDGRRDPLIDRLKRGPERTFEHIRRLFVEEPGGGDRAAARPVENAPAHRREIVGVDAIFHDTKLVVADLQQVLARQN